jgi:NADH-quinone oxidoreductase subunit J
MLLLSLSDTLFYLFSLLAIASAFVVVTTPNPIHAVLFLVSSFAGAGCLLILFGAEYLGVTFIVVYVGAVAIVFLFVIMMLNIKHATLKETVRGRIARYFPVGGILSFLSLIAILYVLSKDSTMMVLNTLPSESSPLTVSCMENMQDSPYLAWVPLADSVTNLEALGLVLYTHYFLHFILAAMLLLVSMILVIVLTGFRHEYIKHQDLFEQMNRSTDEAWTLWNGN